MHFDYLEEHEMLRDAARGYLERRPPIAQFRKSDGALEASERLENLQREAAQGWNGMLIGEADGGVGVTVVEAMVVAEELGRVAHAGAFATLSVVGQAISATGSGPQRAWLPKLSAGEAFIAWATGDAPKVRATRTGAGWRLDGTARLVQDADIAQAFLVDALTPGGVSQFLVPAGADGLRPRTDKTIDVSRRYSDLTVDGVMATDADLLGQEGAAAEPISRELQAACVLTAADSVGVASRLLEMTVAYTKERIAFGKPVAAFQAVKHRCADMLVQVETSRVATWYAAVALRDGREDAAEAASIAKFYATEAAAAVAGQALQLHGGLGMTWEHDVHIYLKRAKANEVLYGTPARHRALVAESLAI